MPKAELTPPVKRLNQELGDGGELTAMENECEALMKEIERTAKEVGGKPTNSIRYEVAAEIKSLIGQLRRINNGTYTFTRSATDGD